MGDARDSRPDRRDRLERAAARHDDVPGEIVENQVTRADAALELLGDEDEMVVGTAIDALEKNLDTVERALRTGSASAAHRDAPGRQAGGRR